MTESDNCDSESPVNRFSSKFSCRKEHDEVLIIGDLHTRNCAANGKTDIMDNFEVQRFVKPGAGIDTLVNSATSDVMKLTKSDVLMFYGGANTVAKNNTR